jgi:hypothetical protein
MRPQETQEMLMVNKKVVLQEMKMRPISPPTIPDGKPGYAMDSSRLGALEDLAHNWLDTQVLDFIRNNFFTGSWEENDTTKVLLSVNERISGFTRMY